jgi:hypothetical protein
MDGINESSVSFQPDIQHSQRHALFRHASQPEPQNSKLLVATRHHQRHPQRYVISAKTQLQACN